MKEYMEEMLHILKMREAQLKIDENANKHELALVQRRIVELHEVLV